jgi:hypothetical protein
MVTLRGEIVIRELGVIARQHLSQGQEAVVLGMTSRGAFIRLDSGWVFFLSREAFRGPLTLNVEGEASGLQRLEDGMPARVVDAGLVFPLAEILVDVSQAEVWQAPLPPRVFLPALQRTEFLLNVARQALARQLGSQISAALPILLGIESAPGEENSSLPYLRRIQALLADRQVAAIVAELEALLGLGSGLTPSGDDLVAGLLLTLRRWGHILAPGLDAQSIGEALLPTAYRKTTTLAANLIECAMQGQANERLILALDGMMTGQPDSQTCAHYLASWGNTSGLDALVGMALILNA